MMAWLLLLMMSCSGPMETPLPLPKTTAHVDREAIRLSEKVRVTLTVEGMSPLRVELPEMIPDETSAAVWHVRPAGPILVEARPHGRERWSRDYWADPFTTGAPLRLGFSTGWVTIGTGSVRHRLTWPELGIRVSSSVQPDTEPRTVTGIEELPPVPTPNSPAWGTWPVMVLVLILSIGAGWGILRLSRRQRAPTLSAHAEALQSLDELLTDDPTPMVAAHRVSRILRVFLERQTGVPAGLRTCEELAHDPQLQSLSAAAVAALLQLLTRCDQVRFAGDQQPDLDPATLIAQARSVVHTLAEPETHTRGVPASS